jgi:glycosyltransferase involved in cell wall biosynthesis
MDATANPRIALVHDWLTGMRGGEKCLEVAARRWPSAKLYTLLHARGSVSPEIESLPIRTSFLQRLPRVNRYYRYLLPLMPFATNWGLKDCDLVLSMSHCVAKSVTPPTGVPHVCYCFSPMRYAWHLKDAYFGQKRSLKTRVIDRILSRIREWDRRTADRVTHFVAISNTIRQRIQHCYERNSEVIYPPVDTDFYSPSPVPREEFYLIVSAFAPYKRIDLAIEACRKLGRYLVVIGDGQDAAKLRTLAGDRVALLGWQPNEVIRHYLRRCRALLFPGEEDFGIVPVEANACGTPVIALGKGGATETIVPLWSGSAPTGVWFAEQSVESLIAGIQDFEENREKILPEACRKQALRFNRRRFEAELVGFVERTLRRGWSVTKAA